MHKGHWFLLGGLVVTIIVLYFSGAGAYITLAHLKAKSISFKEAVADNYLLSVFTFLAACVLLTLTYLPTAWPLALLSGFLFGLVPGVVYVVSGATLGAVGIFLISRYLLGRFVQKRYSKRLHSFNESLKKDGAYFLLMINFLSIVPFSVLGTLAGLTQLRLSTFVWTTAIGFLPSAAVFAFAGKHLSSVRSVQEIISWKVMMLLILLALLAFVPIILKRFKFKDV